MRGEERERESERKNSEMVVNWLGILRNEAVLSWLDLTWMAMMVYKRRWSCFV